MKKLFMILFMLLALSGIASAEKAKEPSYQEVVKTAISAGFTTAPTAQDTGSGLIITPLAPIPGLYYEYNVNNQRTYGNKFQLAAIKGIRLQFENTTNTVVVVSWKDSTLSVNNISGGMPFISGMKYRDAGNPTATPNTIIPPGQKVQIDAYLSSVKLHGTMWVINGAPLLRDTELLFTYYLNAMVNNEASYITVICPGIAVPK